MLAGRHFAGWGFLRLRRGCLVQAAVEILNTTDTWSQAIEDGGGIREDAWVAEATDVVDLSGWPVGTRLILRKERPHPGAQLRFTDSDGVRVTAFITHPSRPKETRPWKVRPPSDTGRPVTPTVANQHQTGSAPTPPPPTTAARKIEARASCN